MGNQLPDELPLWQPGGQHDRGADKPAEPDPATIKLADGRSAWEAFVKNPLYAKGGEAPEAKDRLREAARRAPDLFERLLKGERPTVERMLAIVEEAEKRAEAA